MKNLKKFGSAFLAGTMLLSSFAVSAYAQDSTDDIKYLINDDFSDFEIVRTGVYAGRTGSDAGTWFTQTRNNNGIDHWRIEGMNNHTGFDQYVKKADLIATDGETVLLDDALTFTNLYGEEYASIRILGAKVWNDHVGAGDTLVTEFDIYAGTNAQFLVGLVPESKDITEYENTVQSGIFKILEKSENNEVYSGTNQDHGQVTQYIGAIFKRNEVNHVKVEYTMNDDVSENTKDTVKITITNADGTKTTSTNTTSQRANARNGYEPYLYGIKGISFLKYPVANEENKANSDVYLDNVKVYKVQPSDTQTLMQDDFSNGYGKWTTSSNKSLSTEWFATKDYTDSETGNVILDKAMYIGSNGLTGEDASYGRIYRIFDNEKTIGAGESFTMEFDMIADDNTVVSLNMISADQTTGLSSTYSTVMFLYDTTRATSMSKNVNQVFHSDTQTASTAGAGKNLYSDLKFIRNEKNHIKIDYVVNSDLSAGSKDNLVMTISNSEGTKSASWEADFRNESDTSQKLNGVKGVLFAKDRNKTTGESGNLYIDNVNIYKTDITFTTAEITADLNANGNSSATVTFSEEMTADGLKDVFVKDNLGNKVELGDCTLDTTGKVYTMPITGNIKAGTAYSVVVPAYVTDKAGNRMQTSASKLFYAKTNVSNIESTVSQYYTDNEVDGSVKRDMENDVLRITATTATEYNGKTVGIAVAAYDANGKMIDRKLSKSVANGGFVIFDTMINTLNKGVASYKVFLWDMATGTPLCTNNVHTK